MENAWRRTMECRKRSTPGMNGTKRHQRRFGDRLLYVHYRSDPDKQRRLVTVELIVDKSPLLTTQSKSRKPLYPRPNHHVLVRINYQETGAQWLAEEKRWKMSYHKAEMLELKERIKNIGMVGNGNVYSIGYSV